MTPNFECLSHNSDRGDICLFSRLNVHLIVFFGGNGLEPTAVLEVREAFPHKTAKGRGFSSLGW